MFSFKVLSRREASAVNPKEFTHLVSFRDSIDNRPVHEVIELFKSTGVPVTDFIMDDVIRQSSLVNYVLPTAEMVGAIIAIAKTFDNAANVLFQCEAGVSRSAAAAVISLVAQGIEGRSAIQLVEKVRPIAFPNYRMLALAAQQLGPKAEFLRKWSSLLLS